MERRETGRGEQTAVARPGVVWQCREMLELLLRAYRHDSWANRLVLDALEAAASPPIPAVAAFQHILETEEIWFGRFLGEDVRDVRLWDTPSLDRCIAWLPAVEQKKQFFLSTLTEEGLATQFGYRNQTGKEFTDARSVALFHVLMHSAQYRGEASGAAVAAGVPVPDVDFIFWLRMGEPAPP